MRRLRNLLTLGLATLSLGALAQTPPPGGPGDPGGTGRMMPPPGGPGLLLDPRIQKELGLTKTQIAKIRAIRPLQPKPGGKPPTPPKPGTRPPEEAKIDAILTKSQQIKLRAIRAREDRNVPAPPAGAPPRPPVEGRP